MLLGQPQTAPAARALNDVKHGSPVVRVHPSYGTTNSKCNNLLAAAFIRVDVADVHYQPAVSVLAEPVVALWQKVLEVVSDPVGGALLPRLSLRRARQERLAYPLGNHL